MNNVWLSADWHIGHKKIIDLCYRGFASIEEMDTYILMKYFDQTKRGDTIYILGDLSMNKTIAENVMQDITKDRSVHIILGNHDYKFKNMYAKYCASVSSLKHVKVHEHRIVMCHYAMRVWFGSRKGTFQAYGHSHGTMRPTGKQWDVGIDNNNMELLHVDKFIEIMNSLPDNEDLGQRGGGD